MRGRKPKPTAVKIAAGNPGKRELNEREPRFEIAIPTPPKHLDAEARKEWRRVAAMLYQSRVLTPADRAALAVYCVAYSRWVSAELTVQKYGTVLKSDKQGLYQSPYLSVANRAIDTMLKAAAEFGLTPASRSRIKVDEGDADEDLTEMLFRKATEGPKP